MIIPNRYQMSGNSTAGGMGDIFHCIDIHLDRPVVLKMLRQGGDDRRLIDEQLALIKLRSKHVVQLYDIISVEISGVKKKALVLEHIDGKDLAVETFSAGDRYLKTVWQIACGLADIHREGIIHRDIKPNNIRVDAGGTVKILDFGLARSTGIEAKTQSVIGTLGFMAPELWGSNDISFDQAIDVYAFGITALVLLTSHIPNQLMTRPPIRLPKGSLVGRYAGVPDDILAMLEKCLEYDPSDRPKMSEVEEMLRSYLLFNRHRALLVLGANTHEINASQPIATLTSGNLGELGVRYDGFKFLITSIVGTVKINNTSVAIGNTLPACCVIAFGAESRSFVTFDVSNPEVMP